MKPLDYVIIAVILSAVIGSVVYIVRSHKKGKCVGCGGDCSRCGLCDKRDRTGA